MSSIHPSLWEKTVRKRSFADLSQDLEVDIAIVGGGITGITLADVLQKSGLKVCLLERNELMSGTSGQISAHLSTFWDLGYSLVKTNHGMKAAQSVADALRKSIQYIFTRSRKVWDEIEFKFVPGYYYRANTPEEIDSGASIQEEWELCKKLGFETKKMPKNILPIEIKEGFVIKGQAEFHPLRYLQYLVDGLDQKQVQIFENSPVMDFSGDELITPNAKVRAKSIVHATHTPMGVDLVQTGLSPYRSYVVAGPSDAVLPEGLFWDTKDPYHYIRQSHVDGRSLLIIGGGDQRTGSDTELDGLQRVEEYARRHFLLKDVYYRWSSQVYEPVDGLPYIGKDLGRDNTYIATGFSGDGLTMGTASAMILADLIIKGYHVWEDIFSPRRNFSFNKDFLRHNVEVTKHLIKDRFAMDDTSIESLAPGQGCVHTALASPKAYYKDYDGTVSEMSAVCPHMKCIVHWNEVQKTFDCPCHGSRFDTKGRVIEGPALHGLK